MKVNTSLLLAASGLAGAILLLLYPGSILPQEPSGRPLVPLTRDELIDLFSRPIFRDHPDRVLNDFVRKNKIVFLPIHREVEILHNYGVPKIVTDELKYNFASQIMYRVCKFTPENPDGSSFTEILNTELEKTRLVLKTPGSLLYEKHFNPLTCPATGPTAGDLEQFPHVGYVAVMGAIDPVEDYPAKRTITARLVFFSKEQQATSITKPLTIELNGTNEFPSAASQISKWSIRALESELQ